MTASATPPGAATPRADPRRVTEIHHHARRSLLVAALFTVAAPVVALFPHSTGGWLPLHLFLVGGLLSAISGATQLLAVTWSASPAPPRRTTSAQRWILAAGALAVALGREFDSTASTAAGGIAVIVALVLLGRNLVRIRITAVTDRFAPAIDTYLLAVITGIAGAALAVGLVTGATGIGWTEMRQAHLTLSLYGLVGLVIAGTLPYVIATQIRSRMSTRATPRRLRLLATWLAVATAVIAMAHLTGRPGTAAAGLGAYAAGIAAIMLLLPLPTRRQLRWAGPRLLQLGAGLAWWAATTLLLAAAVAAEQTDRGPILRTLVIGGFAQILVASLAYLGPVVRGGGHRQLTAGFALTRSWLGLIAANTAALGALASQTAVVAVGLTVWIVDTAVRGALLARRPGRRGGPLVPSTGS
jgi:hypothetical protein